MKILRQVLSLHLIITYSELHVHKFENISFGRDATVSFSSQELVNSGFRDWDVLPPDHSGIEPCRDKGECFSGAWFGKAEHIVIHPDLDQFHSAQRQKLLKRSVCEDGSHWFMHHMYRHASHNYRWGNIPGQSVDVLDFSGTLEVSTAGILWGYRNDHMLVLHLSTAERLMHREVSLRSAKSRAVLEVVKRLNLFYSSKNEANIRALSGIRTSTYTEELRQRLNSTVVVIPVIVKHRGLGNSGQAFRDAYLNLTFWSLYPFFRHVVAVVKYDEDRLHCESHSGLPFYSVIQVKDIPDCSLPITTILETRKRLVSGEWKFDSVYYTEGDQILMARNMMRLYKWMDRNPHGIITPHRLVIPPTEYIRFHKKTKVQLLDVNKLSNYSCCLDSENHGFSRVHWKHVNDTGVIPVKFLGVFLLLGNTNFYSMAMRICNLTLTDNKSPKLQSIDSVGRGESGDKSWESLDLATSSETAKPPICRRKNQLLDFQPLHEKHWSNNVLRRTR